jgi:hypothetical protein
MLNKKIDYAFRKDIYLIGTDSKGINYWLEFPSWNCYWYWGFGYIETYTNNRNPSKSRDIQNHSHVNSNGLSDIVKWTMNESERKEFNALFNIFYALKVKADSLHKVNNAEWLNVNEVEIPAIINKIIALVTPIGIEPKKIEGKLDMGF